MQLKSRADIALIVPDDEHPVRIEGLVDGLRERVEKLSGNDVQIVEVSERQLRNLVAHRDQLVSNWADEARTLADRSLSSLIADAR